MARDGSGTYTLPQAEFVNGTTIDADAVNADLSDIATALTGSLAANGEKVPTAAQPMGGFHHTNVGAATLRTDYARADQVIGSVLDYAADTGSATAFAIAPSPGISAYVVGQSFKFKAAHANSGADPTLAVNGLTAGIVYWPDGSSLVANEIVANEMVEVLVASVSSGTPTFHLQTAAVPPVGRTGTQTVAGNKTYSGANVHSGGDTFSGVVTMTAKAINEAQGADIASAGTTDIGAATGNYVKVTGTVTITALGTIQAGTRRIVEFAGILILTHNASSLILPTGANITTAAGDCAMFESEGSGNWRCVFYQRAAGTALATIAAPLTNSLAADVALDTSANYFTGPTVAQGTVGTWWAAGTVTLQNTTGFDKFYAKLWDGTTVIASGAAHTFAASAFATISLSGKITSPAGNIRISVRAPDATTGAIVFNGSGNSMDSTLTVTRIA